VPGRVNGTADRRRRFTTTLWARRPASLIPFAGTPAQRALFVAELAAAGDFVCVCAVGDAEVEEVIVGDEGVLTGQR
jgi:3-hydroxyisobutyrate dehydrogenase-like beta-hydroxyacid dehydrogenase